MAAARLAALLVLASAVSLPLGAHAAPSSAATDLPRYARAVHALRLSLDGLEAAPPSAATVNRLQGEMRDLSQVRLPNGRVVRTAMPLLAGQLVPGNSGALRSLAMQIDALDEALRALPRQAADAGRLRSLDDILADPRFHPTCSLVSCVEDWLGGLVTRFLSYLDTAPVPNLPDAFAIAVLFLLLLGGVALFIVRGALGRSAAGADLMEEEGRRNPRQEAEIAMARAVQDGDYRVALRFLVLLTLLTLGERDHLYLRPDLTNREFLRQLGRVGGGPWSEHLGALIEEFDRAWYGHLPFTAADYDRCHDLASRALQGGEEAA